MTLARLRHRLALSGGFVIPLLWRRVRLERRVLSLQRWGDGTRQLGPLVHTHLRRLSVEAGQTQVRWLQGQIFNMILLLDRRHYQQPSPELGETWEVLLFQVIPRYL